MKLLNNLKEEYWLCKFFNLEIDDYFQHANNNKIHTLNLIKYFVIYFKRYFCRTFSNLNIRF